MHLFLNCGSERDDNTLASGSRFAVATSRFAAVLDASSLHDAILQRVREFFAHAMHE